MPSMSETLNTRTWSTPAVIGAGPFVAITGVMPFLGVQHPVSLAHGSIGIVFAIAILLHLPTHRRAFRMDLAQPRAVAIIMALLPAARAKANGSGPHELMRVVVE